MHARLTRRLMLGLALAAPMVLAGTVQSQAKELRVLAWQGYADDDWVKEFETESGATVKVVFIGTDDEIWAKIKGSEGKDFDLYAVNTAQLQRYIDAGLTTPYDLDKLPNQQAVLERFRDLTKVEGVMRDGKVYAIPYPFDSIGIIYDKDKVNPPPDTMDVLWDLRYQGKLLLFHYGEYYDFLSSRSVGKGVPSRPRS